MPSPATAGGWLRDLRALAAAFTGRKPPPWTPRDGAAWEATGPRRRRLRVAALRREGPDAVVFTLEDPTGARVQSHPGQFLTLLVNVGGEEHRRAYSLCGPPGVVSLCVRRVPGGRVSTHLVSNLREGQALWTLGPSGTFGLRPDPQARRSLLLVSGGSGVTPNLAIAWAVLETEPHSEVCFVLGDRSLDTALLRPELEALARLHPQRLRVLRSLEAPAPGHLHGRLDAAGFGAALEAAWGAAALPAGLEAFVCGPEPMMEAAVAVLRARGLPPGRVHLERFTAGARLREDDPRLRQSWPARLRLGGREHAFTVRPGSTLLEAALAAGVEAPYSCAMGGCGACRLTLRSGEVAHREPNSLDPDEPGAALTCCAYPLGPVELEGP